MNFLFAPDFKSYVFEDIRKRSDLALLWIYNKYLKYKDAQYKQLSEEMTDESVQTLSSTQSELEYNHTVQTILLYLQESNEM